MGLQHEPLERLLAEGRDSALLRMGLALAYHRSGGFEAAREHIVRALDFDPDFAAAWRLHGLIALALDDAAQAASAFTQGLAVAQRRGDRQLVRELEVRLRRLGRPPCEG
ncbi:hypothetical protein AAFF27_25935 [Xylophilus sp. GW821-FHT01B05]